MSVEISSNTYYGDPYLQPRDGGVNGGVMSRMGRDIDWSARQRNYDPATQLAEADERRERQRAAEAAQEAVGMRSAQIALAETVNVAPIETTDSRPTAE